MREAMHALHISRLLARVIAGASFGLAMAAAGTVNAQASACGCDDLKDMRNRLCEAQAAISEYGRHISNVRAQERKDGTGPVMFSERSYKVLVQPCVQEAINQVTDSSANRSSAATDNACKTTFNGSPTACMKEVLTSHENVHVTACMKVTNDQDGFFAELRGKFQDTRANQTMVELLNEERAAYQTEMTHIRDQMDRLSRNMPSCQGMPTREPGPGRIYTPAPCPPPKPRPPADQSECRFR